MSDEQVLIGRAQRGEKDAFRQLVERSKITTYRLAYDLTGNRHDAEDLSQEVYIRAFRALPNFRGESKWSSWLYRITMNTYYDQWRTQSKRQLEYRDDMEETVPTVNTRHHTITPERSAQSGVIQHHINRALDALTPQERSVFVLRHYHDLPLKEIADTLKLAEGSVKSYLFRAIKRLQKELAFYKPELGLED